MTTSLERESDAKGWIRPPLSFFRPRFRSGPCRMAAPDSSVPGRALNGAQVWPRPRIVELSKTWAAAPFRSKRAWVSPAGVCSGRVQNDTPRRGCSSVSLQHVGRILDGLGVPRIRGLRSRKCPTISGSNRGGHTPCPNLPFALQLRCSAADRRAAFGVQACGASPAGGTRMCRHGSRQAASAACPAGTSFSGRPCSTPNDRRRSSSSTALDERRPPASVRARRQVSGGRCRDRLRSAPLSSMTT